MMKCSVFARVCSIFGIGWLLLAATVGCPTPKEPDKPAGPPPGTVFRVLVVGDAVPTDSLTALRTEWQDQSGWKLEVVAADRDSWKDRMAETDVAILPAPLLGEATEANLVQPFPDSFSEVDA
ncbi:MAG: hypothetical protein D6741_02005, partial [Planctomycetota bacterium]